MKTMRDALQADCLLERPEETMEPKETSRDVAKRLAGIAWNALFEAQEILEIADLVANAHEEGDCEVSERRVDLLVTVANEKRELALDALERLLDVLEPEDEEVPPVVEISSASKTDYTC